MPRKKTGLFDQREYDKTYHREHTIYRKVSFNNSNPDDMRMVEWIDSQPEATSAYIRRLILEDMTRRQNAGE